MKSIKSEIPKSADRLFYQIMIGELVFAISIVGLVVLWGNL